MFLAANARVPVPAAGLQALAASGLPRLPPGLRVATPLAPPPRSTASAAGTAADPSCYIDDPGFGVYDRWVSLDTGRVVFPTALAPGPFDLVIHFHGSEAARQLLAEAGLGVVLAGVDAGVGGAAYERAMADPAALESLVGQIEMAAQQKTGAECRAARIILSSWSAGYGAVRQILLHDPDRPQAIVLLDSLYASYVPGTRRPDEAQMAPFVEAAERAATGGPPLVFVHSEVPTATYASTAETADFLVRALGGQRRYAGLEPLGGAAERTRFGLGNLEIRGYAGATAESHCAALTMLPDLLRDVVLPTLRAPLGPAPAQ